MDRFGLIPPEIRARLEHEEFVGKQAFQGKALDQALRAHDPDLSLVWIKTGIHPDELPGGAIPGRWHVKNDGPRRYGLPADYTPVAHPDGSYREPDFGVLREMQERDTTNLSLDELVARANAPSKKQREKPLKEEQRLDELKADFKTAKRVAGEGGLTQRRWARGKAMKGVRGGA